MTAQSSHWLPHGFVYNHIDVRYVETTYWQTFKQLDYLALNHAANFELELEGCPPFARFRPWNGWIAYSFGHVETSVYLMSIDFLKYLQRCGTVVSIQPSTPLFLYVYKRRTRYILISFQVLGRCLMTFRLAADLRIFFHHVDIWTLNPGSFAGM
jgi:hypothetical protein